MAEATTQVAPRFKGQPIELGGTSYTVPPLAIGAVKELLPRMQTLRAIDGIPSAEDIDTMVEVVHAAITRNYPDMTRETLLELLDLGNMADVFRSIMGRSGLTPVAEGNAVPGAATP
jgi:hypothetical protein